MCTGICIYNILLAIGFALGVFAKKHLKGALRWKGHITGANMVLTHGFPHDIAHPHLPSDTGKISCPVVKLSKSVQPELLLCVPRPYDSRTEDWSL